MTTVDVNVDTLEAIRKQMGLGSRAEVVRRAVTLLSMALAHGEGGVVQLGSGEKSVKVIL